LIGRRNPDSLGNQKKNSDSDDGAGAETQNQMQLVAQTQRQQAAQSGAQERCDGND
jgi:hypothetical protein